MQGSKQGGACRSWGCRKVGASNRMQACHIAAFVLTAQRGSLGPSVIHLFLHPSLHSSHSPNLDNGGTAV